MILSCDTCNFIKFGTPGMGQNGMFDVGLISGQRQWRTASVFENAELGNGWEADAE
jgi:hypothetical protein